MRIIATQGEARYLLVKSKSDKDINTQNGQVLDLDQKLIFPPQLVGSIIARGYWDQYKGTQDVLPALLDKVEVAPRKK